MQEWLYGNEGYYRNVRTIGKEGDFYTAVSTSMFFGGSIAKRLISTIESGFLTSSCTVVEIGAHKGYLLADMIQFIYTLNPELLQTLTFVIVEPFSANQAMQKNYFEEAFGDAVKVLHVKRLEAFTCKEAFFVANEIFDAFPCELIKEDQMLFIEKDQAFFETMDSETKAKAKEYGMSKGELCLEYEPFADAMNQCCERFEFVTFDYGDKEARGDFSLRVYANHQVYPFFALTDLVEEKLREKSDFNGFFAKADITYDVNFSHLFYAFEKNGIHVHDYATQMKALVDFGLVELLELFAQNVSEKQYEREMNKIKTLIDPSFMGERFKMACFRKGEA
ncbi:SAM-dependent methyltransferase [Sulfurospirillum diekertiae]|uniref:SAM-dependent methyltransferase n=2 Tax=Sulfurospirillum diekertiae TaxID=1854492 RepID=A0AA92FIT3_9BACT|nr:SAM-dependent methyltransferase [Sulfurospirillum diekertiae]